MYLYFVFFLFIGRKIKKAQQWFIFVWFCQIQKYLDLIKIHSLAYKWFCTARLVHINPHMLDGGQVYKLRCQGSSICFRGTKKIKRQKTAIKYKVNGIINLK